MHVKSHSGRSHLGSRLSRGVRPRLFGVFCCSCAVNFRVHHCVLHGSSPVSVANEILANPVLTSHMSRIDWFDDSLRRVDDGRRRKETERNQLANLASAGVTSTRVKRFVFCASLLCALEHVRLFSDLLIYDCHSYIICRSMRGKDYFREPAPC